MAEAMESAIAQFVTEFAKAYRATTFYPVNHPTLLKNLERAHIALRPLFYAGGEIALRVTKHQVLFADKAVQVQPALLKELSFAIFKRRMKIIHIGSETTEVELQHFLELLTLDAGEVQKAGGPEKLLAQHAIMHIWCNEVRFSKQELEEIAAESEEGDATSGDVVADMFAAEAEPPAEENPLALLLQMVQQQEGTNEPEAVNRWQELLDETDKTRFTDQVKKEIVAARKASAEEHFAEAHSLALVLFSIVRNVQSDRRIIALKGLKALVTENLLLHLIHQMLSFVGSDWETYRRLIGELGTATVPYLLHALAETESRKERMRAIECVVQFGEDAEEYLLQQIDDPRWYVVRNSLHLLEAWARPEIVGSVAPLLHHSHEMVRREATILLRKSASDEAFAILVKALKKANQIDTRFLLSELSYFPSDMCEPIITPYLSKGSLPTRIQAAESLAILASPAALTALAKTFLGRAGLFGKEKHNTLRKAIGEALLPLLPDSMPIFERARDDETPAIRKLIARADSIMKRKAW